jgi:prepilin peptidase CpaA
MITHESVKVVGVIALGLIGSGWDLSTRRVPNRLTFGAAAFAFAYSAVYGGGSGLLSSVLGCLTGLALFFPFFALGGMGAGDVKFLAAFGAFLGPVGAFWAAIWGAMIGGGLAIMVALSRGYLKQAIQNVSLLIGVWRTVGVGPIDGFTLSDGSGPRLAYAVPIALGALVALWTAR